MKKIFALIFPIFFVMCAFAESSLSNIAIDEQVLDNYRNLIAVPTDPGSRFASENSTIDMNLSLIAWDYSGAANVPLDEGASLEDWRPWLHRTGYVDQIEEGPLKQPVCKMVKISNNWLIGDSHCLPEYIRNNPAINSVPSQKEQWKLQEFASMQTEYRGLVYEIKNNEVRIDGEKIDTANHLFIGKDVMLLYVPDERITLKFHQLSPANIRVSKNPTDMKTVYINETKIENPTITETQMEVSSRFKGGTPAFYKKGYQEFLIGFNASDRGKKSKVFKLITEEMKIFIENSVKRHTPDEWNSVLKKKIVSDNFFTTK